MLQDGENVNIKKLVPFNADDEDNDVTSARKSVQANSQEQQSDIG